MQRSARVLQIFPGGSPSDWISARYAARLPCRTRTERGYLPEAVGRLVPGSRESVPAVSGGDRLHCPVKRRVCGGCLFQDDTIWSRVHEKLDYAHWAQDMTAEYEDIVRKFQIEDSKRSDRAGRCFPVAALLFRIRRVFQRCKRRSAVSGRRYHLDERTCRKTSNH